MSMIETCDSCSRPAQSAGRLWSVHLDNVVYYLCKECRKKFKVSRKNPAGDNIIGKIELNRERSIL